MNYWFVNDELNQSSSNRRISSTTAATSDQKTKYYFKRHKTNTCFTAFKHQLAQKSSYLNVLLSSTKGNPSHTQLVSFGGLLKLFQNLTHTLARGKIGDSFSTRLAVNKKTRCSIRRQGAGNRWIITKKRVIIMIIKPL